MTAFAHQIEQDLLNLVRSWGGENVAPDAAIYQDNGINGYDFYELLCAIDEKYRLPPFDWSEFADMAEPPHGLTLFGRLKILPRKRLTPRHLAKVLSEQSWSEP